MKTNKYRQSLIDYISLSTDFSDADLQNFANGYTKCYEDNFIENFEPPNQALMNTKDALKISLSCILDKSVTMNECEKILEMFNYLKSNSGVNLSIEQIKNKSNDLKAID